METDGVDFFFFTFPLRQSLENTSCLRACTFEAEAPIFCAGGVQSAGSKHLGQRRLPRCFFFLMYTTCMFSCMFAWGDAPVSNEAVFVLIKRGGGARARWGMGTFESHTMRDETASNIHHDVPCGT